MVSILADYKSELLGEFKGKTGLSLYLELKTLNKFRRVSGPFFNQLGVWCRRDFDPGEWFL